MGTSHFGSHSPSQPLLSDMVALKQLAGTAGLCAHSPLMPGGEHTVTGRLVSCRYYPGIKVFPFADGERLICGLTKHRPRR